MGGGRRGGGEEADVISSIIIIINIMARSQRFLPRGCALPLYLNSVVGVQAVTLQLCVGGASTTV